MTWIAGLAGLVVVAIILWDAYETILLPRRLPGDIRLSRLVLRTLWLTWRGLGRRVRASKSRELFLSFYAQLSLILLLGVWAAGLVTGFAAMQWAIGSHLQAPTGIEGFPADLYLSGTTFFTLGLGDVIPMSPPGRLLTVIEAGLGFGHETLFGNVEHSRLDSGRAELSHLSFHVDRHPRMPPAVTLVLGDAGLDHR